jgi:nucleoside-diphosphate-sugar epimerase
MNQRILVTGGAGFVGRHLTKLLLGKGAEVRTLDLEPLVAPELPAGAQHLQGDIRDRALMRRAAQGVDVVVHAAAGLPLWKPDEIASINADGTSSVLEACEAESVRRLVHISTTAVYGNPGCGPLDETAPLLGQDVYSRSKIAAEEKIRSFRDRICIPVLRAKLIIGPGRLGICDVIFDWVRRGKHIPMIGSANNLYQMLHVEDLSSAIWLAATRPAEAVNDTFNIAAAKYGTVREDFQAVLDHAGFGRRVVGLPAKPVAKFLQLLDLLGLSPLNHSVTEAADKNSFVSIEKARRALGWEPKYSNVDALIGSYDWYVRHLQEFEGRFGVSHGSRLKQGALAFARMFF